MRNVQIYREEYDKCDRLARHGCIEQLEPWIGLSAILPLPDGGAALSCDTSKGLAPYIHLLVYYRLIYRNHPKMRGGSPTALRPPPYRTPLRRPFFGTPPPLP